MWHCAIVTVTESGVVVECEAVEAGTVVGAHCVQADL